MSVVEDPELVFLFPLAVYKSTFKYYQTYNQLLRNNLKDYIFESTSDLLTGEYNGQTDIHLIPQLEIFFNEVTSNIRSYIHGLGYKENLIDIYITKCWLSIIDKDDLHMRYHSHTSSDISFVYYLDVPENSDVISFANMHKPNEIFPGALDDGRDSEHNLIREYNTANFNTYHFYPHEGMFVAFPGGLNHGTIANPKATEPFKGRRIAVVGDTSLHLKPEVKGLEIGRIAPELIKKFT
jgi:hypothetical protein